MSWAILPFNFLKIFFKKYSQLSCYRVVLGFSIPAGSFLNLQISKLLSFNRSFAQWRSEIYLQNSALNSLNLVLSMLRHDQKHVYGDKLTKIDKIFSEFEEKFTFENLKWSSFIRSKKNFPLHFSRLAVLFKMDFTKCVVFCVFSFLWEIF